MNARAGAAIVEAAASAGGTDRGAQARLALISAGIHEFGEFGPEGASTRRIAQRAGQNIAAIAYYFGGKEGLYLAIMRHIVETMTRRNGALLEEIEGYLESGARPAARALDLLRRMLVNLFIGGDEMVPLSQMIVREQTHPTRAFEILFAGWLQRPHRLGARLIAAYVGAADPDAPQWAVHYHMLLGAVLAFRVARQTLLLRLGAPELNAAQKALIAQWVAEHTEDVLKGLRARHRREPSNQEKRRHP